MIVREPMVFAQITIPANIVPQFDGAETDLGLAFNYQLFFQTLHAYSAETLAKMVLTLSWGEKSTFKLEVPGDRVFLPNVAINQARIDEFTENATADYPSDEVAFQLSLMNDGRTDFLQGIEDCLDFVSPDDKKNNAFALYNDRIVVNDNRHVFVYSFYHPVTFMHNEVPVSLHKKSAKLFLTLAKKQVPFNRSKSVV